jgi:hypothetical protein
MIIAPFVARGRSPMNCPPRRWVPLLRAALALWLFASSARAEGTDEAKRHFTNGVHMFEDRNFAGALVEFEASYQRNPTAVALQNIAVCQKGLFRYADAIATLERMLRDFSAQLSPDDKKAAEDAIRDMSALIGTVILEVTPPDAKVSINDAPLSVDALKQPIRLAAGEYHVAAEAPGYARQEKMVTVVSGQNEQPIVLTLSPLSGMLVIRAHDSQAAIAIDGAQVGYDEWKGPVSAGSHQIYVYTSTQRHKSSVTAYAGQTTEFDAKLTAADAVPEGKITEPNGPPPYVPPSQRGLFGFVNFGFDSMGNPAPAGLTNAQGRTTGGFFGVRLGYRFSTLLGVEIMVENSRHQVDACVTMGTGCAGAAVKDKYDFSATHIGPAVRLMSNGRKGRVVGTVALGAAVHSITYPANFRQQLPDLQDQVTAAGSFFQMSGGYELNFGHFLLDGGLVFTAETANQEKLGIKNAAAIGLDFRVGYGQW